MNTLVNSLKDRDVGVWCKRAAWIVVAFSLINIGLSVYGALSQYSSAGYALTASVLVQSLRFAFPLIPSMLFSFFILYAAGVLVDHFVSEEEEEDTDEIEEEIIEDAVPSRDRASR
jgi:polyferredoxin